MGEEKSSGGTVEFYPLVVRMKKNGKDQVVLNGQRRRGPSCFR